MRDMRMIGNFTRVGLVESSNAITAVDRGGNGATGNGQEPQCVGVARAG